jgi:hypothetical protein
MYFILTSINLALVILSKSLSPGLIPLLILPTSLLYSDCNSDVSFLSFSVGSISLSPVSFIFLEPIISLIILASISSLKPPISPKPRTLNIDPTEPITSSVANLNLPPAPKFLVVKKLLQ